MKMSLFQGILIGVFGLSAVIGLFVFSTYSGDGGGAAGIGEVRIWGTLPQAEIENTLAEIRKIDDSIEGVKYSQVQAETLATSLTAAIASRSAPDLILASQEELLYLIRYIAPISSDTLPVNTFISTFVNAGNLFLDPRGGGFYGLPYLVDPMVLFWNNDILASNGVAKPPATWEELNGLVPRLAVITPTKQITRGLIALGSYNNVQNARGVLSTLFLQTKVPISIYSPDGTLTADLGIDGTRGVSGQAVVGFYTLFADPTKTSYTWNGSLPNSRQAFLAGDLALYLGFASEALYLRQANPNLNFNVAPMPQPGTATVKSTYGLVYALMIPNGSKNPVGGYKVAALLTGTEKQTISAKLTGLAPATRNAQTNVSADPVAVVAYASALYAKGWLSPPPASVDQVFSSMIGNVITGRLDLTSAISRASGSLNSLLQ